MKSLFSGKSKSNLSPTSSKTNLVIAKLFNENFINSMENLSIHLQNEGIKQNFNNVTNCVNDQLRQQEVGDDLGVCTLNSEVVEEKMKIKRMKCVLERNVSQPVKSFNGDFLS